MHLEPLRPRPAPGPESLHPASSAPPDPALVGGAGRPLLPGPLAPVPPVHPQELASLHTAECVLRGRACRSWGPRQGEV